MSKSLVAYFSASGVTAKLAKTLAKAVNGDIFEIIHAQPYTKDDLNWMNKQSRSSVEMNDKSSRPAVSSKVENMEQYNTIYIGFPIWWYTAPSIINTFLEQYDLSGKIVIPFATSGGSQMGKTNDDLVKSCPGAILKNGKRFSANAGIDELRNWAESL
jgi:flavodoxin